MGLFAGTPTAAQEVVHNLVVGVLTKNGKRSSAERVLKLALEKARCETKIPDLEILLLLAVISVRKELKIRRGKIGRVRYVGMSLKDAAHEFVNRSRQRSEKTISKKLAGEIVDSMRNSAPPPRPCRSSRLTARDAYKSA